MDSPDMIPDNLVELDPLIFGGGGVISVDGGTQLMYVAEEILLSSEYELTGILPRKFGEEESNEAHFLLTFKGRINNTERAGAMTVMMDFNTTMALLKQLRTSVARTPLHLRGSDK